MRWIPHTPVWGGGVWCKLGQDTWAYICQNVKLIESFICPYPTLLEPLPDVSWFICNRVYLTYSIYYCGILVTGTHVEVRMQGDSPPVGIMHSFASLYRIGCPKNLGPCGYRNSVPLQTCVLGAHADDIIPPSQNRPSVAYGLKLVLHAAKLH